MALLANIKNVIAPSRKVTHEVMCFGHIGAGSVYTIQAVFLRSAFYKWGNTMCGENNRAFRDLFQDAFPIRSIKCDCAQASKFLNCVTIMYDLSNNIDRARHRWVFRHLAHNLQCIYHPITIPTGRNFNDFH